MKAVMLTRTETSSEGTFGQLTTDGGFRCVTGELPWRDNLPGCSCVPAGIYICIMQFSPKHKGNVYHLQKVPNRTDIEIHSANLMGDESLGFKCQLLGCIAPGTEIGKLENQKAVMSSKYALLRLETEMNNEPFELTIKWADGIGPGE